jgi:hypothetical protein
MPLTSNSLDSSDSHFTGRLPPPYHLVDVMKQFSFNYARSKDREPQITELRAVFFENTPGIGSTFQDLCRLAIPFSQEFEAASEAVILAASTQEGERERSEEVWSIDSLRDRVADHYKILDAATRYIDRSRPAQIFASLPLLGPGAREMANQDSTPSILSSEDGGALLPPLSTSGSVGVWSGIHLGNLDILPEHSTPAPEPFQRELSTSEPIRAATVGEARATIKSEKAARGLSAAMDHKQYASYLRQHDRNREKIVLIPYSTAPSDTFDVDSLTSREFDQCSQPWALSSIYV